jgi:hypothetical protein
MRSAMFRPLIRKRDNLIGIGMTFLGIGLVLLIALFILIGIATLSCGSEPLYKIDEVYEVGHVYGSDVYVYMAKVNGLGFVPIYRRQMVPTLPEYPTLWRPSDGLFEKVGLKTRQLNLDKKFFFNPDFKVRSSPHLLVGSIFICDGELPIRQPEVRLNIYILDTLTGEIKNIDELEPELKFAIVKQLAQRGEL